VFVPLFGVFDFHLLPPGRFDLYAGPLLGYSWYDELFGASIDDHFIYGLGAGLDVVVGGRWAISGAVRFIQAEAEFREATGSLKGLGEINEDPWQVEIGVAYRFGKAGP
jgi:outer membrane protein W